MGPAPPTEPDGRHGLGQRHHPAGATVSVVIEVTATAAGAYTNTATLTPAQVGPRHGHGHGRDHHPVGASIAKSVASASIAAGTTTSFTITMGSRPEHLDGQLHGA